MKYFLVVLTIISSFLLGHYLGKKFNEPTVEKVIVLKKEIREIIVNRQAERTAADVKISKISKAYEAKRAEIQKFDLATVSESIPESKIVDSMVCLPESTAKEYLTLKDKSVADSQIIETLKTDRDSADSKLQQYAAKTDTLLEVMEKDKKLAINSSYKRGIVHGIIGTSGIFLILGVVIWF
jgi:hypothetical protein